MGTENKTDINEQSQELKQLVVTSTNQLRSGVFADTISLFSRDDSNILDFYFNDTNSNDDNSINAIHQARIILTPKTLKELGKLINDAVNNMQG